jgi:hypothetical protein
VITDWTSMFPPGSDEYWPELQEQIDYWEKRLWEDPGMFNQLIFFEVMGSKNRAEAAEKDRDAWMRRTEEEATALELCQLHGWRASSKSCNCSDDDEVRSSQDGNVTIYYCGACGKAWTRRAQEVQP